MSYDPNVNYNGNFFESRILPDPSCSSFTEPLTDGTSTWIDVTTDPPKRGSGYQPQGNFAPHGPETIEMAPEGEGPLITSLEEAKSMGNEGSSGYFSTVMGHNIDLSGLRNCSQPALQSRSRKALSLILIRSMSALE